MMTEAGNGSETAILVEQQLQFSCGPAMLRGWLKEAFARKSINAEAVPSQQKIAKEVYTWKYGIFKNPLRLRDNWCLPTTVHKYLDTWFKDVNVYNSNEVKVDKIAEDIEKGMAVGVLMQDKIPDRSHPGGYEDSLDNGHWVGVSAINLKAGWIELADSYRNKKGNERWFDEQGMVLTDGNFPEENRSKLSLEHRQVYRMSLQAFIKDWWDYKFDQKSKYQHVIVAVDLDSLRELDKNNRPIPSLKNVVGDIF
ncbi:MAG: hypothetical protein V1810_00340 [Candidatus Beckwithbacteria bacterium]